MMKPVSPEPSRGRAARLVARVVEEAAIFAGMLVIMWALFAYVLPRFGIYT